MNGWYKIFLVVDWDVLATARNFIDIQKSSGGGQDFFTYSIEKNCKNFCVCL